MESYGRFKLSEEKMISAAKTSGANIVKFQYWDPKYLKDGPWDSDGRREIYNKAALTPEKVIELKEISESIGCIFLISVFWDYWRQNHL